MVNDHFVLLPWRSHELELNSLHIPSFMAERIIQLAWIQFQHLHLGVVLVPWSFPFNELLHLISHSPATSCFWKPCLSELELMVKTTYNTTVLISRISKVMLKILQARLQQYMNQQCPDVQAGLRKCRGTRDQIANIWWIMEKTKMFQKDIYFCFLDYAKAFDCVDHKKLWKILKQMEVPGHFTCLLRILYAGQKVTESDMEQMTGSTDCCTWKSSTRKLYIVSLLI